MGRKYASLHVRFATAKEEVFQAYKRLTKPISVMDMVHAVQKLGGTLSEKEVSLIDAIIEPLDCNVRLKEHNGYIIASAKKKAEMFY